MSFGVDLISWSQSSKHQPSVMCNVSVQQLAASSVWFCDYAVLASVRLVRTLNKMGCANLLSFQRSRVMVKPACVNVLSV